MVVILYFMRFLTLAYQQLNDSSTNSCLSSDPACEITERLFAFPIYLYKSGIIDFTTLVL